MERQKIKLLGVLLLSKQSVPFFIIRGYTNSDQAIAESKINALIIRFDTLIHYWCRSQYNSHCGISLDCRFHHSHQLVKACTLRAGQLHGSFGGDCAGFP